ncbi:PQ loop repeat-domain-containing protein [Mrakia frigida]|uniref:Ilt1p n=1 Tax=Mrakia frigida TaxID=29902 RepID=UPI003FCC0F94
MGRENATVENVMGTIGTILWCIQIIPQIVMNYRRKNVVGLSPWLMFIWSFASIFLGAYAIAQSINIPIIVQPQLFGFLSAFCWVQCLYYGPPNLSKLKATIVLVVYLVVFAGMETGLVYAVRAGVDNGTTAPLLFFGILSAVLLCGALLPQYYEIWKFKEVVGLSLIFMFMDMSGGVFCTLSLIFKKDFDIVAGANYIGIVLLDGLILILACILNPRANRRRKREARAAGDEEGSPSSVEEGERGRDVGAISGVDRVEGEGLVQVASRLEEERRGSISKGDGDSTTVRSSSR